MGDGVSVHGTHVINTVCPYLPEVVDHQVSLLLKIIQIHGWIVEK